MDLKVCSKCDRKLPKNTDYYFKKKDTKDGFTNRCKECVGKKFTDKLIKIPKDDYKFCIKCNRELKISIKYFPPDKTCKDNFRSVCRECGKDGHFMDDNYIPIERITEIEIEKFLEIYPDYTTEEMIEKFYHSWTKKKIDDLAYRLRVSGHDNLYKTKEVLKRSNKQRSIKQIGKKNPMSEQTKEKLSIIKKEYFKTHKSHWIGRFVSVNERERARERVKGKWSGKNNPNYGGKIGSNNPNWKGGRTPLYFELRTQINRWKQDSMKNCDYKCVITNEDFDNIHHLYGFRDIVDEVFEILKLDIRQKVEDYLDYEFNNICFIIRYLHDKYGLGVCLRKDIHKLFHDNYGYTDSTSEQFYEFKERYKNGELN